jgi:hypothetical protein
MHTPPLSAACQAEVAGACNRTCHYVCRVAPAHGATRLQCLGEACFFHGRSEASQSGVWVWSETGDRSPHPRACPECGAYHRGPSARGLCPSDYRTHWSLGYVLRVYAVDCRGATRHMKPYAEHRIVVPHGAAMEAGAVRSRATVTPRPSCPCAAD